MWSVEISALRTGLLTGHTVCLTVVRTASATVILGAGSEIKERRPDGERRARAYNGGLEAEPPAGSRAEPPGQGSSLLALQYPKEGENLALHE